MALTGICILNYNNYFNRKFLRPPLQEVSGVPCNVLSQYTSATLVYEDKGTKYNFYKNDDVNSSIILNTLLRNVDYLIEYDAETKIVLSRWFVVETKNNRLGQQTFSLRRDLLADYYENIKDAPAYIEKATCGIDDVAIYNQEQLAFNQIKTSEKQLIDKSQRAWIVGYYTNLDSAKTITVDPINIAPDITYSTTTQFNTAYNIVDGVGQNYSQVKIKLGAGLSPSVYFNNSANIDITNATASIYSDPSDRVFNITFTSVPTGSNRQTYMTEIAQYLHMYRTSIFSIYYNTRDYAGLNGKILYCSDTSKYYRITVTTSSAGVQDWTYIPTTSTVHSALLNRLTIGSYPYVTSGDVSQLEISYTYETYSVTLSEITIPSGTYTYTLPTTAAKLEDAPYNMFVIPYQDDFKIYMDSAGNYNLNYNRQIALRLAVETAKALGTFLIDLQLLPYMPPLPGQWPLTGGTYPKLNATGMSANVDYAVVKDANDAERGFVLFPKKSIFSFELDCSIINPSTAVERKVTNQCDMWRLSSPNYAAAFDFNVVKTGTISKLSIDCTYKPFNPYIHINPIWAKLYGADFDDTRGLIIQGDFSVPILNDAWIQYQINNKNYLNAFNRQVDSIELQHKMAKISDVAGAISGSVSGVAAGAIAGGVPGAIAGGVASTAAGIFDVYANERIRRDSLDLTKDQFNYSLENIQALPNTLAKVSAFDNNNKLFPLLEYYTCTEQEKDIFREKIRWNGMTIMRIDKISTFAFGNLDYIKGRFIQLPDIYDDFHIANEIANEFNKGWYI